MEIKEIIKNYPEIKENIVIVDMFTKAISVLQKHNSIVVSISGGADSDLILDILEKTKRPYNEVHYTFFDTGLELDATKEHLNYLEGRYGITIERIKPERSVPWCVRHYGTPVINKFVSHCVSQLQRNNFEFTNEEYLEVIKKYNKCKEGIKWWTNYYYSQYDTANSSKDYGIKNSYYNICWNAHLKEYILKNPIDFKVSDKCCYYAKKKTAAQAIKKYNADLDIVGLRKAEGGRRSIMQKCFFPKTPAKKYDTYYPIFWFKNEDKKQYEEIFNIVHSRCYTEYGMKRTGCVGCPFDLRWEEDLQILKQYEPIKYRACNAVFGRAYEWQKSFKEYKSSLKSKQDSVFEKGTQEPENGN